jgi:hypothetical protein
MKLSSFFFSKGVATASSGFGRVCLPQLERGGARFVRDLSAGPGLLEGFFYRLIVYFAQRWETAGEGTTIKQRRSKREIPLDGWWQKTIEAKEWADELRFVAKAKY